MKRKQDLNLTDVVQYALPKSEDSHVKLDGSQPPWCEGLTTFFTFKHCLMHVKHRDYFMESERVWDFHTSW